MLYVAGHSQHTMCNIVLVCYYAVPNIATFLIERNLIGHWSPVSFPFKCDLPIHWSDPSIKACRLSLGAGGEMSSISGAAPASTQGVKVQGWGF